MRYHNNRIGFYDVVIPLLAICSFAASIFLFTQEVLVDNTINLNEYIHSTSYDDSKFPSNGRATVEITECYGSFYTKHTDRSGRYKIRPFDYYYVVKLEDDSLIAIQTNTWRVKKFDKITYDTLHSGSTKSIKHEGFIGGFSDSDIENKYKEYTDNLIANKIISENTKVRYLIIANIGSRKESFIYSILIFLFGLFFY